MTTTLVPAVVHGTASHLSAAQVQFFDDNGYLILRDRIPAPLLHRLRESADRWIAEGWRLDATDPAAAGDYRFAERPTGRTMFRVDYLHSKGEPSSLELLGSPAILGIAESLAGPNFVPTYESMVFKSAGDATAIRWHQDAVQPRHHRIFNVDVYLDSSRRGSGALRVVPRSQMSPADVCALETRFGWDVPDVVHAEMEPGDVLVHDTMIVHGSEAVSGNALRRTLYYEFRAAEQIESEGPWDREWIDRRMRLVPLALAEHAERYPGADQFRWNAGPGYRPERVGDGAAELRIVHTVASPGTFCSAGSVSPTPP